MKDPNMFENGKDLRGGANGLIRTDCSEWTCTGMPFATPHGRHLSVPYCV